MPADPAVDLITDGHDDRQQQQPQADAHPRIVPQPDAQAHEREHQNADDDDDEQEARAAAGVEARLWPHVLDRQRQALFVAEDGLVLRAVVGEHTLDVLHVRHGPQIQQEDDDAQQSLEEVAHDGALDKALGQTGEQRRQQDEQHDRQRNAEHHGRADDDVLALFLAEMPLDPEIDLAGLLLLVLGQEVGGIRQRLHALDHRVKKYDHAADERPSEDRVLFLDKV